MPFLALAVLGGSYYQANQQRKAMEQARMQSAQANAVATQQMEAQIGAQREQAAVARQRLEYDIAKNATEKAALESSAKKAADELDAERRSMGEQESARMKAMRRSSRSLLSESRLSPELGLGGGGDSFGAGVTI
jgi:chromosome segregation ATPase